VSDNSTPKNINYISGVSVYNVSPNDDIVNIDTSLSAVTVVLPNIQNAQLNLFRKNFYINDAGNNAFTNNITIIAAGGIVNSGQVTRIKINTGSAICTIVDTNEYQVVTDNPVSGGGSSTYGGASPTTVVVEDFPIGTNILGLTYDDLFQNIYAPYVSPSFTSFLISGFPTSYEVGDTISGTKSFAWSFSNISNVSPSTMDILDVTGGTALATNISNVSPASVAIATYTPIIPASYSWRGQATNTQLGVFLSSLFTVNWFWRKYFGTNSATTLNESQIEALINNPLSASLVGSYSFAAGDYKYFCWPDSFGSPSAGPFPNGFVSGGFSVSMASVLDNPFYSNTQNGWSYGLVSVTNINGVATNYRVYRTLNTLGSTVIITVN
jgi:hypothetical protein